MTREITQIRLVTQKMKINREKEDQCHPIQKVASL